VATSGDRLLAAEAVQALREELLPLSDLITPNLPEAADLLGESEATDEDEMQAQLARLTRLAPGVLLKGGHLQGESSVDLLSVGNEKRFREATGGIATAMALGGTMIVPDSTVSVSFNLATFQGEQGFSGAAVVRLTPRVYVSGGFAGSTVKGTTGGRVGVAFGF
jgi:hypothetical protein